MSLNKDIFFLSLQLFRQIEQNSIANFMSQRDSRKG